MVIEPGTNLMHYRIVEKLGEGGMGQVWKALDTTLDREVAIKVLPATFAGEADRLARFEQEAKLLASLNHPNIAAVYSVHHHEGVRFLAMELVAGEDVARRLERGPLPLDDALEVAIGVAQALEAAHDNGVIHRDLKPANIQLTPEGKVKVLDFGLAKGFESDTTSGDPSFSPTITSAGTVAGMILGTAAYMSPEQARGRPVDRRADVWAFGCVLYEMLSGRKTFDGETVSDILASVLKVDPEWDAIPESTPPAIRRLIRRCLTRDADQRLAHISGALPPLRDTLAGVVEDEPAAAAEPVVARPSSVARLLPWLLVLMLAAVAGVALLRPGGSDAPLPPLQLVAPFPKDLVIADHQMGVMALSPAGSRLALTLTDKKLGTHLYVRRLAGAELTMMPDTENASTPFFSPDGEWIGFFANNKLKKIPIAGGSPVTLCDSVGSNRGASWGTDDRIVFSAHYTLPLSVVGGSGGTPTALTAIDTESGERTHRWPQSVPDEDLVIFTVGTIDSPENYDGARIDALRPSTGARKTILEGASFARYLHSGYLVFARQGFLFAVAFDVTRLEVEGSPVPVVENVMGMRSSGAVYADFSTTGLLTYVAGEPQSRRSRLVWRYRDGRSEPLSSPVAGYQDPRMSPDGRSIAIGVEGDTSFDIWVYDLERETMTRLTFEGDNAWPLWSPDGTRIAFASVRDDRLTSTYVKNADGSGEAELIYSPERHENAGQTFPTAWSRDGRTILIDFTDRNGENIAALDLETGESRVVLATPVNEQTPVLAPDGRWMAYASDESGRFEIYVRPFPGPGGKWQVSVDGGVNPVWSRDGRELFFQTDNELFVAEVEPVGRSWKSSRPRLLIEEFPASDLNISYDVMDAERFVSIAAEREEDAPVGVTVIVNWLDDLRRRVPRP